MTGKTEELFKFLAQNRLYNKDLQERYYRSIILPYKTEKEKIISLLYHIANTQSQPKIDHLACSYKSIISEKSAYSSFMEFIEKINPGGNRSYESLYRGMIKQKGWGEKTAALFCKSIFHLHNGNYSKEIRIWDDVPSIIARKDIFYLPVDAVIIAIFNKLEPSVKWNFTNINKFLRYHYNPSDIEIWDDLWFWGFITQNGSQNRIFEWNENKYWILKESDKNQIIINKIKTKCCEFLSLIN